MRHHISKQGFTLIELLIVVAIIAILAAIAVPNFLEAQTRAKVSRVKNDMRALSVAMESYRVDINKYPCRTAINTTMGPGNKSLQPTWCGGDLYVQYLTGLTSPVAYMSGLAFRDPFQPKDAKIEANQWFPADYAGSFFYTQYGSSDGASRSWGEMMRTPPPNGGNWKCVPDIEGYCIGSHGPDRLYGGPEYGIFAMQNGTAGITLTTNAGDWVVKAYGNPGCYYDPTNGTVSFGDIARYGGSSPIIVP